MRGMSSMEFDRDEASGSQWQKCALAPRLGEGEAHVWSISLRAGAEELSRLTGALQPSELARAERFRFEHLRIRFLAGRASLRLLLGQYLDRPAREIGFVNGPHGKPELAAGPGSACVHFNFSNSENLGLLAVTRVGSVGVDVEQLRPVRDAQALVARFFSPRENREFSALPEAEQPAAFFNLWTRKEALLKATGEGIAHSLNQVEVTFRRGEPARLLALPRGESPDRWCLKHLDPAPAFVGALVVRGTPASVSCLAFQRSFTS